MSHMQKDEMLQEWSESAPYWDKHRGTIRTMFAPVTEALIEEAGIVKGHSVLDVAAGPGEPSITIAERVGPTGSVMCTDAVADMVAAARREARRRELTNIRFCQCVADSLPLVNNSFDAVVSRLGVMLFPDPVAAAREMLRVTKPGGGLSFAVWHNNELNPFIHIISDVVSQYIESPASNPEAPGAFRFAQPGKLMSILKTAGVCNLRERLLHFRIEAPISLTEFWTMRSETSDTLRKKLAGLSPEQVLDARKEVQEAVRDFFSGNQMSFPAQMIVVGGKSPQ